jgi:hypothetical protein
VIRRYRPRTGKTLLEYYDLSADPAEQQDLAARRTSEAEALAAEMLALVERLRAATPEAGTAPAAEFGDRELEALRVLGYLDEQDED